MAVHVWNLPFKGRDALKSARKREACASPPRLLSRQKAQGLTRRRPFPSAWPRVPGEPRHPPCFSHGRYGHRHEARKGRGRSSKAFQEPQGPSSHSNNAKKTNQPTNPKPDEEIRPTQLTIGNRKESTHLPVYFCQDRLKPFGPDL